MKIRKLNIWCYLIFLMASVACSGGHKETEYQKIIAANRVEKNIQRKSSDRLISFSSNEQSQKEAYPWQQTWVEKYPYITKEFFRCNGDKEHPSYLKGEERIFDCNGCFRHSLPLKDGKEFVYPILIHLLNYLQTTLDAPVVITCGHRCPQHSRYSDPSEYNRTSKHMIGGEVDFYVVGYEKKPQRVVEALMSYYQQEDFDEKPKYRSFNRYQKKDLNVATAPWYNQEVFIKIYQTHEGRDFDNNHSYPYVSIQVRYDPETKKIVTYTWEQAFYSYLRY